MTNPFQPRSASSPRSCRYSARAIAAAALTTLLAVGPSAAAPAAMPSTLQVSQVLTEANALIAYVDVRDEAGTMVSGIEPGQIHATVGAEVADLDSFTRFAETGEGVTYLFLVDISQSIVGSRFAQMQASLRDWVAALQSPDQAGLIAFGSEVRTLVAPTADRAALTAAIDALAPTDLHTQLHAALLRALDLSRQRAAGLPRRRAIVVLSDGLDDAAGGPTADEVLARLAEGAAPVYGIGFSGVRDRARREAGLAALGRFARQSGGSYVDAGNGDPAPALAAMRQRIREAYRAELRCDACPRDGNRHRVQIALRSGGLTLSDGRDLRLYPIGASPTENGADGPSPQKTDTATPSAARPRWLLHAGAALAGFLFLAVLLAVWRVRRGRGSPGSTSDADEGFVATTAPEPALGLPRELETVSAGPAPMAYLTFLDGARRGEEVAVSLERAATLGRDAGCALALAEDDLVSARHARLVTDGDRILLKDLGSTNGTFLNGIAIRAPHPLADGDLIRVGASELRLRLPGQPGD